MKVALRLFLGLYLLLLGSEELFVGPGLVYGNAACMLLLFIACLAVNEIRIRFTLTGVSMALFGVICALSIFWSVDADRTTHYAFMLSQLLFTAWVTACCIEDGSTLEFVAWCLLLSPVIPGFFMTRDFLTGSHTSMAVATVRKDIGDRMSFAGADPNLSAFRCAVATLSGIHLGLTSRSFLRKLLIFPVTGFIIFSSLLTGSRGGALALLGGATVLLLVSSRRRKATVLLTMVGFTVLLITAMPYLPKDVSSRYLGIGNEITAGEMANRRRIYKEGIQSFNQSPTLGVGFIAFASASRQRGGLGLAAHNDSFQVLLDLGLVGLGIFILILAGLARNVILAPVPFRGYVIGLFVCYLISSLSITLICTKMAWAVYGIILGVGGFKWRASEPQGLDWHQLPLPGAIPDE